MRVLGVERCACHLWVVDMLEPRRKCGRCDEKPVYERTATERDVSVCLHDGPCGK